MAKKPMRVREAVMVYLDGSERALLERVVEKTGQSRTELLRQGLWQVASRELAAEAPGSAFQYLIDSAGDEDIPPDVSARPDHYLYGGGYEKWFSARKAAKPRARKKRAPVR